MVVSSKGSFKRYATWERGVDEKGDDKWHKGGSVIKKVMSFAQIFYIYNFAATQFLFSYLVSFRIYNSITASSNENKP